MVINDTFYVHLSSQIKKYNNVMRQLETTPQQITQKL